MLGEIVGRMAEAGGAEAATATAAAPALLLSAGLVVGMAHALDPDHVVAMLASGHGRRQDAGRGGGRGAGGARAAPLRAKRALSRGSLLGALWGAGHTSTILLVSAAVFAFSLSIPDAVFAGLEAAVGLMLVALGVSAWTGTSLFCVWQRRRRDGASRRPHPHSHAGGGTVHTHPHSHAGGEGSGGAHRHGHRSYLIGCMHGLAGSGGLIALGVTAMESMQAGIVLILAFGAGSVAGMMLASGTLSLPFALAAGLDRVRRALQAGIGAISVAVGIAIVSGVALAGAP